MAEADGMARMLTWAGGAKLSPEEQRDVPAAAEALLRDLARNPHSDHAPALAILAGLPDRVSPATAVSLARVAGETFRRESAALAANSKAFFRYVITVSLALGDGPLLTGDALSAAVQAEARGAEGALAACLSEMLGGVPEQPADEVVLPAQVGRLIDRLAQLASSMARDAELVEARDAVTAALDQVAPSDRRQVEIRIRQAFERAVRSVRHPQQLRAVALAFGPFLREGELATHPVATLLAPWEAQRSAVAAPRLDVATEQTQLLDTLLDRLEQDQDRLPRILRRPTLALALVDRLEERLTKTTHSLGILRGIDRFTDALHARLSKFDRRFGLLSRLLDDTGGLRLGSFFDFSEFGSFDLGRLSLVLPQPSAGEASSGGGLGFGSDMSFGGLGGLGGMGGMGLPGFGGQSFGGGGGGLTGLATLGKLPAGLQRLVKSGKLSPAALSALLKGGGGLGGLSALRSLGSLGSLSRGRSSFGGSSFPAALGSFLRAPGGYRHLALGLAGGRMPTQFSAGFSMPSAPRAGLLMPAIGRSAFQFQRFAPSMRGSAGGLPAWSLPAGLRGSFAASSRRGFGPGSFGQANFGGLRGGSFGLPRGMALSRPWSSGGGFQGGLGGGGFGSLPPSLRLALSSGRMPNLPSFRGSPGGGGLSFARGLPTMAGFHDLRLDGFGRPRLRSGGSPLSLLASLSGLNLGSSRGGFGSAPRLSLGGGFAMPRLQFGSAPRLPGGVNLGGVNLGGLNLRRGLTAFGQDLRLPSGSMPLFPGAGLRWKAPAWNASPASGSMARWSMPPQLLRALSGGGFSGGFGGGSQRFAGSTMGLPAGFTQGFGHGFSGYTPQGGGSFSLGRDASAWRALLPSLGSSRLPLSFGAHGFGGFPSGGLGFPNLQGAPRFSAPPQFSGSAPTQFSGSGSTPWRLGNLNGLSSLAWSGLPSSMSMGSPGRMSAWGSGGFSLPRFASGARGSALRGLIGPGGLHRPGRLMGGGLRSRPGFGGFPASFGGGFPASFGGFPASFGGGFPASFGGGFPSFGGGFPNFGGGRGFSGRSFGGHGGFSTGRFPQTRGIPDRGFGGGFGRPGFTFGALPGFSGLSSFPLGSGFGSGGLQQGGFRGGVRFPGSGSLRAGSAGRGFPSSFGFPGSFGGGFGGFPGSFGGGFPASFGNGFPASFGGFPSSFGGGFPASFGGFPGSFGGGFPASFGGLPGFRTSAGRHPSARSSFGAGFGGGRAGFSQGGSFGLPSLTGFPSFGFPAHGFGSSRGFPGGSFPNLAGFPSSRSFGSFRGGFPGGFPSGSGSFPAGSFPAVRGAAPAGRFPALGGLPMGSFPGFGAFPSGRFSGSFPSFGGFPGSAGSFPGGGFQGSFPGGSFPSFGPFQAGTVPTFGGFQGQHSAGGFSFGGGRFSAGAFPSLGRFPSLGGFPTGMFPGGAAAGAFPAWGGSDGSPAPWMPPRMVHAVGFSGFAGGHAGRPQAGGRPRAGATPSWNLGSVGGPGLGAQPQRAVTGAFPTIGGVRPRDEFRYLGAQSFGRQALTMAGVAQSAPSMFGGQPGFSASGLPLFGPASFGAQSLGLPAAQSLNPERFAERGYLAGGFLPSQLPFLPGQRPIGGALPKLPPTATEMFKAGPITWPASPLFHDKLPGNIGALPRMFAGLSSPAMPSMGLAPPALVSGLGATGLTTLSGVRPGQPVTGKERAFHTLARLAGGEEPHRISNLDLRSLQSQLRNSEGPGGPRSMASRRAQATASRPKANPFQQASATPGADLSRHLMGQPTQGSIGHGALGLGSYDATGPEHDGGITAGGWRGLAAHELVRPARGLRDGIAAPRGLSSWAEPRSPLDLASGLDTSPRIVPGLARSAHTTLPDRERGSLVRQGTARSTTPSAARPLSGGAQLLSGIAQHGAPQLDLASSAPAGQLARPAARESSQPSFGSNATSWQHLARNQLEAQSPVFGYGVGEGVGSRRGGPQGAAPLSRRDLGQAFGVGDQTLSGFPLAGRAGQRPARDGISLSGFGQASGFGGRLGATHLGSFGPAALGRSRSTGLEASEPAMLRRLEHTGGAEGGRAWSGSVAGPGSMIGGRSQRPVPGYLPGTAPQGFGQGWGPGALANSSGGFASRIAGRSPASDPLGRTRATLRPSMTGAVGALPTTQLGEPGRASGAELATTVRAPRPSSVPRSVDMTQVERSAAFTQAPARPSAAEAATRARVEQESQRVAGQAGKPDTLLRKSSWVKDIDPGGQDTGELAQTRETNSETAHVPQPPRDLSLLVSELHAQIKRQLQLEQERLGSE